MRKYMKTQKIYYDNLPSNIGNCIVAATEGGLCSIRISDNANYLRDEFSEFNIVQDKDFIKNYKEVLSAYLNAEIKNIDLPCDMQGTEFKKKVWQELQNIPCGETRYYSEVACNIGSPKAYRAVATACSSNPIALVVPCHRVLPRAGGVGQYLYGSDIKERLLEMESK